MKILTETKEYGVDRHLIDTEKARANHVRANRDNLEFKPRINELQKD